MSPAQAPSVSPSRRGVLDVIKRAGEASAEQVADQLDISVAGARQHLSALSAEGLVVASEVPRAKGERGRPQLSYTLSARAEPLFPKAYAELANELLRYVEAEGDDLVDRVFTRRRDTRIDKARARLASKDTFEQRVAELATILDEDGYLADWEARPDGTFRITEHNCAVLSVAQHHPSACRSEIEFLQTVLPEAWVERVSHIVAGAHQCAYVVSPIETAEKAPGKGTGKGAKKPARPKHGKKHVAKAAKTEAAVAIRSSHKP